MFNQFMKLALLLTLFQVNAYAADKTKMKMRQWTPEQKLNMATVHEKMATCLKSEKSYEDCKMEMVQSCQSMMGKDECPMWGKKGKGMMWNDGMMREKSDDESESKK